MTWIWNSSICVGSLWPSVSSARKAGSIVLFGLVWFLRKSLSWACSWKEGWMLFLEGRWVCRCICRPLPKSGSANGLPLWWAIFPWSSSIPLGPVMRNISLMPIQKMQSDGKVICHVFLCLAEKSYNSQARRDTWGLVTRSSFSHSLHYFFFLLHLK